MFFFLGDFAGVYSLESLWIHVRLGASERRGFHTNLQSKALAKNFGNDGYTSNHGPKPYIDFVASYWVVNLASN